MSLLSYLILVSVAGSTTGVSAVPPSSSVSNASIPASSAAAGPPSSNSTCKAGFLNAVFNTGAPKNAGWPGTTWSTLTQYGINDWSTDTSNSYYLEISTDIFDYLVGFSLTPLNEEPNYDPAVGVSAPVTPALNAAQISIVMNPDFTTQAVQLLSTAPPIYLELYNEPDYSFQNDTPLTGPVAAAQTLKPLFAASHPSTQYISPALANANSNWLPEFNDSCSGCFDQIDIISMHLYSPQTDWVLGQIESLHSTWPDKRIWITELGPASSDCTLNSTGIVQWAQTLIPGILKLGYVGRIFWNCGEHAAGFDGAANVCNPSLTNDDGSATDVLKGLAMVCGIGG
ncbi:hypothetical protein MMC28_008140 [Mycoblastus sanguinarius]|nr:hypothetical protein [Mycoblastus sanguinarius]